MRITHLVNDLLHVTNFTFLDPSLTTYLLTLPNEMCLGNCKWILKLVKAKSNNNPHIKSLGKSITKVIPWLGMNDVLNQDLGHWSEKSWCCENRHRGGRESSGPAYKGDLWYNQAHWVN